MASSSALLHRTKGTVTFSNPRYGFIELSNKNIPIQTVYFDSRSVQEGKDCNLSEKYPKGTNVSFTFIPTEADHKVKYRAINMIKQKQPNDRKQKKDHAGSQESRKESRRDPEHGTNGWESYLHKYISEKGAQELNRLVEGLKTRSDNCPKSLKNVSISGLVDFVNEKTEQLEIKLDFVCVCELEHRVHNLLEYKTQAGGLRLDEVRFFFKASEQPGSYLHGQEKWPVGFFNFIARNADHFVVWNGSVWKFDLLKLQNPFGAMFQSDLKAVKYYSQFAWEAPVPLSSLCGHFAQAPPEVKAAVSAKEEDFKTFLRRNSFVLETFKLNHTAMVKCHPRQLSVIDQCWTVEKTPGPKKSRKRNSKSNQGDPINNNYMDAAAFAPHSKTFTDLQQSSEKLANLKFSQPCSDEGGLTELFATKFVTPVPLVTIIGTKPKKNSAQNEPKKSGRQFYGSKEEKSFKNVIGQEIADQLERKLLSNNLTLQNLILLRLNVGKHPVAKIFDGEATYNSSLENTKEIDTECLQRIIRNDQVVRSDGSQQYAVKNTLCSLRVLEQNGKLSGLTVFCQLHEDRDGIGIDIKTRKRLSAVISDPERLPLKYVYNYLRTQCRELSRDNDVLVIDIDGQLSGCNDRAHHSLGNLSRMLCASSVELSEKINEAVQHSHDYVVVIGVDGVEILEKIQKMCSKGIKVVAEIPNELLKDVERMFPA